MDPKDLFEILVKEHAEVLAVFLRSAVRDPALADDLFQETLIVAWRRLDDFDKTRPFGPWLRGIAARLVMAERRKSGRLPILCEQAALEYLESRCHKLQDHPGDTLDEKLESLRECIQALPDRFRDAIRLRYQENVRGTQLAQQLKISVENSKKRLQRGRAQLLDCLERKLATTA